MTWLAIGKEGALRSKICVEAMIVIKVAKIKGDTVGNLVPDLATANLRRLTTFHYFRSKIRQGQVKASEATVAFLSAQ